MASRSRRFGALVTTLLLGTVLVACSSDDGGSSDDAEPAAETIPLEGAGALDATVSAGVEYVMVRDAEPGTELRLVDADDTAVPAYFAPLGNQGDTGTVDDEGLLLFGRVPAGDGYRV